MIDAPRTKVPVIDLSQRYGQRYKIGIDPAVSGLRKIDPMYLVIPCKIGEIYPFGGELLAAMVTGVRVANEMRSWPELTIAQDASDAVVFVFDVEHFLKVAKRIGARKRRRLSSDHRMKLVESGRAHQFSRESNGSKTPKSGRVLKLDNDSTPGEAPEVEIASCESAEAYRELTDERGSV